MFLIPGTYSSAINFISPYLNTAGEKFGLLCRLHLSKYTLLVEHISKINCDFIKLSCHIKVNPATRISHPPSRPFPPFHHQSLCSPFVQNKCESVLSGVCIRMSGG